VSGRVRSAVWAAPKSPPEEAGAETPPHHGAILSCGRPEPTTLVVAGDISCRPELVESASTCRQARTAGLVQSLAPGAVAALGDNQYEHGELANFQVVYEPTWGRFKPITHPAVGNHEYEGDPERDEAPGYYTYFGPAASDPQKGYYR